MYSPAALPSRQRAAPAKKRRLSAITGISSFLAASIGFPALSASRRAISSPCSSIRSASASSACARCAGVVPDQPSNAPRAAFTARSTSSGLEIGARASSSPVAGFRIASVSPPDATDSPSMKLLSVSVVLAIVDLLVGWFLRIFPAHCRRGALPPRSPRRRLRERHPQRLRHRRVGDLARLHVQAAAQTRNALQGLLH